MQLTEFKIQWPNFNGFNSVVVSCNQLNTQWFMLPYNGCKNEIWMKWNFMLNLGTSIFVLAHLLILSWYFCHWQRNKRTSLIYVCLVLGASTLTHRWFALKAHLKHVVVFCGECKLSFCCIFLGVESVAGWICNLQGKKKQEIVSFNTTGSRYFGGGRGSDCTQADKKIYN